MGNDARTARAKQDDSEPLSGIGDDRDRSADDRDQRAEAHDEKTSARLDTSPAYGAFALSRREEVWQQALDFSCQGKEARIADQDAQISARMSPRAGDLGSCDYD